MRSQEWMEEDDDVGSYVQHHSEFLDRTPRGRGHTFPWMTSIANISGQPNDFYGRLRVLMLLVLRNASSIQSCSMDVWMYRRLLCCDGSGYCDTSCIVHVVSSLFVCSSSCCRSSRFFLNSLFSLSLLFFHEFKSAPPTAKNICAKMCYSISPF